MTANMSMREAFSSRVLALAATLVLDACAEVPTDPIAREVYDEANDPAEPTNRVIFAGNQWVDRNALQPVARAHQDYVPGGVRSVVRNFGQNLQQPFILANDVLQGNMSRAWNTTQRFVVNSTVGGAGLFDVAREWDLPPHDADFGQTLGVWGVGSGPTVQLPLLGPSNLRDTAGMVVSLLGNPVSYVPGIGPVQAVNGGFDVVDSRARLLTTTDDLEKNSVDYYAALRSLYAQDRAAFIEEGKAGDRSPDEKWMAPKYEP